ncbi:MAG: hypothetical protein LBI13_10140 [Streptococcaceae bacterium]|jgi:hypothetical protein|nr:hypothetical protein [Streptococcaceae bacterium]
MKARKGEVIVELWQISKENKNPPSWVEEAFEGHQIRWGGPQTGFDDKLLQLSGGWIINFGKIGDYLEFDRGKFTIISEKRFKKDYSQV